MGDTRPSIAELQRMERDDFSPAPWEVLEHWSRSDLAKVRLRNAAPLLLEIAAAALDWLGSEDDDRAPETARLEAALGKVRP